MPLRLTPRRYDTGMPGRRGAPAPPRGETGPPAALLAREEHGEDRPHADVVGEAQRAQHELGDEVDRDDRVDDGGDGRDPCRRRDTVLAARDRLEEPEPHAIQCASRRGE
jgi:hypothetical protein